MPRNIGIRNGPDAAGVVLIDWEHAGIGAPVFEVVHFLGNPLREDSDHFELLDHYLVRYREDGGRALDTGTWTRSGDLAFAHYAVTYLPFFGRARLEGENSARYERIVEHIAERVKQGISGLKR